MDKLVYADLVQYLALTVTQGASDLHLTSGAPPMVRLHGQMVPITDYLLTPEVCRDLLYGLLTETQRIRFEEEWELDFALQIENIGRFRGNAHFSRGSVEAVFRHISDRIPNIEELGHSPFLYNICDFESGLIIVTGTTGSGKSTTMASMVQHISNTHSGVIITIEDPIEYVFQNGKSLVKQREVGSDTKSFLSALKYSLRQDPDVILVGEMRDAETMQTAITAAETGHLVLATLHTIDAPKAIDRIVDAFSAEQQPQIVAQLSNALAAVISQRLLPHADGKSRALASEILVANHAVKACIRDQRYEQLAGLIEIGSKDGMNTIDESLIRLMDSGAITLECAMAHSRDKDRVMRYGASRKV